MSALTREKLMTRRERRRLNRFHRKCDRLGVPSDVRHRIIRMAAATGEKLKAPDWYAGRDSAEGEAR